jgi:UTP:GlnB (protein PII) uridylyltransferase
VLREAGCTIEQASIATWPDGCALASYRVRPQVFPHGKELERALAASFAEPLVARPVADVTLSFDDAGSPWHTRCTARGHDRPGLLHELTAAFAVADVSVHAARITTDGPDVVDHFDLTDRRGAKLDERTKARALDVVLHGATPRRRKRTWREWRGHRINGLLAPE